MTGTRKNKGGHFWHTADYLKDRGDTAKQNRGFFGSGPLRPAEAESANKTERGGLTESPETPHARSWERTQMVDLTDQYNHATINAYSSFEFFFFF